MCARERVYINEYRRNYQANDKNKPSKNMRQIETNPSEKCYNYGQQKPSQYVSSDERHGVLVLARLPEMLTLDFGVLNCFVRNLIVVIL